MGHRVERDQVHLVRETYLANELTILCNGVLRSQNAFQCNMQIIEDFKLTTNNRRKYFKQTSPDIVFVYSGHYCIEIDWTR